MHSCWKMKLQNEKPLGHSASRSSNISKLSSGRSEWGPVHTLGESAVTYAAGSPTSVNAPCGFSRTSVTPSNQDICSSNASALDQEQVCQKPAQTAVVLLNSAANHWPSQSITTTTLCLDSPIKPKNKSVFGAEWLSLLKPSVNLRPHSSSTLKFSKSLNDVGQKTDVLSGSHFAERTCSDGELRTDTKRDTECGRQAKTLMVKLTRLPPLYPSQHRSFSTNYGYESAHFADTQKSSNLLRLFFPFPRSFTAGSLSLGELAPCTKPSNAVVEVNKVCSLETGDDDVFEEEYSGWRLGAGETHAPLCTLEEDGDLDCRLSPLKTGPPSPYSLTEDCCRLVRFLLSDSAQLLM